MIFTKVRETKYHLEILLAVKDDGLGLDLAVLDVDLVAAEDDGDVLADPHEVSVPVRNVLVRDASRDIKHDHRTLTYMPTC